jgi:NitT/TauT family transport system permease protein/putative hydroxymethylpyrimidine transport system permease protein
MKRWLLPTLLLVGLAGAWQVAASTGALADLLNLENYLVPSPVEIGESLWQSRALLAENAWVTLSEVLTGFGCALVAGVGFAVAMHLSATLRLAFQPLIIASQTIPIVVLAPILVVVFGFGNGPTLVIIGLVCFFPITVNTLDGLRSVDSDATKMMRTLDASRGQILRRVEAPSALPYFFSGAKIAVAVAVIGAVLGELAAPDSGLGALIFRDMNQLETARAFAAVALLSAMAIALFGLLALAERRVVTWR